MNLTPTSVTLADRIIGGLIDRLADGWMPGQDPDFPPILLWGPPGLGKTALPTSHAARRGLWVLDERLVTRTAPDVRGVPTVVDGDTVWARPDLIARLEALAANGPGVLLLDELPQASMSVQNAALQLCRERRIGDWKVPDNVLIVAAGNRRQDGAGVGAFNTALAGRFVHLEVKVDTAGWLDWARANDVHPSVWGLIRTNPGILHDFDPKRADIAQPSPRGWKQASDVLKSGLPDEALLAMLGGIVGAAPAGMLMAVHRSGCPDVDAVLADPDGCDLPSPETHASQCWALCMALCDAATTDNWLAVVRVASRMPREYAAAMVADLGALNPKTGKHYFPIFGSSEPAVRRLIAWVGDLVA